MIARSYGQFKAIGQLAAPSPPRFPRGGATSADYQIRSSGGIPTRSYRRVADPARGWNRTLTGRIRDRLIGRDVGAAAG